MPNDSDNNVRFDVILSLNEKHVQAISPLSQGLTV